MRNIAPKLRFHHALALRPCALSREGGRDSVSLEWGTQALFSVGGPALSIPGDQPEEQGLGKGAQAWRWLATSQHRKDSGRRDLALLCFPTPSRGAQCLDLVGAL